MRSDNILIAILALFSLSACAPSSAPDVHRFSPQARAALAGQLAAQRATQQRAAQAHAQNHSGKIRTNSTAPVGTTGGASNGTNNGGKSLHCRITNILPRQYTQFSSKVGKAAGQVIAADIQNEKFCQSLKVTISNGTIVQPKVNWQIQNTGFALLPSQFTSGEATKKVYSTFIFHSQMPNAGTGQLILAYILPGVDPTKLVQQQPGISVKVQNNVQQGFLSLGPRAGFQLESLSLTINKQVEKMTVVQVTDPPALVSANYIVKVQLANSLISNPQTANGMRSATPITVNESETQLISF